ncbi:MAG: aminoacyl-tRNA hydrolase [Flavobacteriaceae bacterium]|nr:aminoacyl-tRNA hydrolase [Flavobacteriaceae bacterium]
MFSFKGFFKKDQSLAMHKFLIVGLGNIGPEYENTRHNIGFKILDKLAEINNCVWEIKKLAYYSSFKKKGRHFVMIKPSTFMNRSGKAVRHWALKERIPIENILILTDELHLPFGTIRVKPKGNPAGHNGLKDIEKELNTANYARLRFGIGHEVKVFDSVKFVLDNWDEEELEKLTERIKVCLETVVSFGLQGLQDTMSKYNGK